MRTAFTEAVVYLSAEEYDRAETKHMPGDSSLHWFFISCTRGNNHGHETSKTQLLALAALRFLASSSALRSLSLCSASGSTTGRLAGGGAGV